MPVLVIVVCCLALPVVLVISYCMSGYALFDQIRPHLPTWVADELIYLFWPGALAIAIAVKQTKMLAESLRNYY